MPGEVGQALLIWLVLYLGLLGAVGFGLYLVRAFSRRRWSNAALLRAASTIAFVLAVAGWLVVVLSE
ncbi:MAG: hypothetical protein PVH07_09265 [Chloroflexota bacterium]|jgi:hypothetical protein